VLSNRSMLPIALLLICWPAIAAPPQKPGVETRSTARAPALPDPQQVNARVARDAAWCRNTLVHGYEANGARDPKWDASALDALKAIADLWSRNPQRPGNEHERAWRASQKAVSAGCADPLILYVNASMYSAAALENLDEAVRLHREATTALDGSKYSPLVKARAHVETAELMIQSVRAKGSTDARGIAEQIESAREMLPAVAEAKDIPQTLVVDLVGSILDLDRQLRSDRKESFDAIAAVFAKARPAGDVIHRLLKARFLIDYAWDARGGQDIAHVTGNAQAVFASRLDAAEREAAKAAAIDPLSPVVASLVLTIELGQGIGRERMESWFHYGTAVDPGSYSIYGQKLRYLEPQWYGSPEDMIAYGQELLAAKQFSLKFPFILAFAYFQLSQRYEDPSEFYQEKPQTCRDITAIYDGYLKQYPEASYERSGYALMLYYCGQYAAANQQFKTLGSDGRIGPFLTRANYDNKRTDSAVRAAAQRR
jgi:hypothetical protein